MVNEKGLGKGLKMTSGLEVQSRLGTGAAFAGSIGKEIEIPDHSLNAQKTLFKIMIRKS